MCMITNVYLLNIYILWENQLDSLGLLSPLSTRPFSTSASHAFVQKKLLCNILICGLHAVPLSFSPLFFKSHHTILAHSTVKKASLRERTRKKKYIKFVR